MSGEVMVDAKTLRAFAPGDPPTRRKKLNSDPEGVS